MACVIEILSGFAVVVLLFYYYLTSTFDFWKARGIAGPRPIPIFGNMKEVLLGTKYLGDYAKEVYDKYKSERLIGIFARRTPRTILVDPELIKDVLIKDFSKFADRGLHVHEKTEPLSVHLFNLEPRRWRPLRTKLSPVFTSGKLREMFKLILECSKHFETYMESVVAKGPIECRELTAKYTTDVIGSCAFGLEMNSMSEKEGEFRKMGRKIFTPTLTAMLRLRIREAMPWLYDLLGYVLPERELSKFFTRVVKDTMQYRRENNIVRHDFIDILLDIANQPEKLAGIEITDYLLTAQAFVFFAAGFETSSTTISNALYELALNVDIQDKLRQEIDAEYAKNNEDLRYEHIKEMTYLDQVFRETLRKYPPVSVLLRKATSRYTFQGTKVTVEKGHVVWIPVYAIQRDPDIYPDPDAFKPERFSEEIAATRHQMYFLPFGDGPRNCIGARFGVYQTKIGLIKILRNYKVETCEKTMIPYVNNPRTFLLAPKDGIVLKFVKIDRK